MRNIINLLDCNKNISDYKININNKESYQLFFVKGKLETVRNANNCDKEITIYVNHDEYKGEAQFFIYPSTTEDEINELINKAVAKALLINNQNYELPKNEVGSYEVESNFKEYKAGDLAYMISNAVFKANDIENASLNSVEVFVNKHIDTIINSQGINKTQITYDAMVEAIPTYNGQKESVELYEQYNFGNFDEDTIINEIKEKLLEVKARHEAIKPDFNINCNIILNKLELSELFDNIAYDLNYSSVYSQANVFKKNDNIQNNPTGDLISITMAGEALGNIDSSRFDSDGMSLTSIKIVDNGKAVNYFGSNRYGQYLNEKPTGALKCIVVDSGSACPKCLNKAPYLEILSMSGLQVDFYSDYIGGEIRLAYYNDGNKIIPVTGISFNGKLSEVLSSIRLSKELTVCNSYNGPKKAILSNVKIF